MEYSFTFKEDFTIYEPLKAGEDTLMKGGGHSDRVQKQFNKGDKVKGSYLHIASGWTIQVLPNYVFIKSIPESWTNEIVGRRKDGAVKTKRRYDGFFVPTNVLSNDTVVPVLTLTTVAVVAGVTLIRKSRKDGKKRNWVRNSLISGALVAAGTYWFRSAVESKPKPVLEPTMPNSTQSPKVDYSKVPPPNFKAVL